MVTKYLVAREKMHTTMDRPHDEAVTTGLSERFNEWLDYVGVSSAKMQRIGFLQEEFDMSINGIRAYLYKDSPPPIQKLFSLVSKYEKYRPHAETTAYILLGVGSLEHTVNTAPEEVLVSVLRDFLKEAIELEADISHVESSILLNTLNTLIVSAVEQGLEVPRSRLTRSLIRMLVKS